MTDERTLKELAEEALQVQDACNLSGVVLSWGRSIVRLRQLLEDGPGFSTRVLNEHPINRLWADKVAHLTNTQMVPPSVLTKSYDEVRRLAGL